MTSFACWDSTMVPIRDKQLLVDQVGQIVRLSFVQNWGHKFILMWEFGSQSLIDAQFFKCLSHEMSMEYKGENRNGFIIIGARLSYLIFPLYTS